VRSGQSPTAFQIRDIGWPAILLAMRRLL
jgi:hypothetical protein